MAVTYEDVAGAAATLAGRGIEPSVRLVQQSLGGGSNSTIGPHLKTWREVEGDEDSDLPPALVTLVRHAHKTLKLEAETALAEERAELEGSRQLWEVKYAAMEGDLEDAKRTVASQKDMIKGVVSLKDMLDEQLSQHQEVSKRNKLTNDELHEDLEKQIEENHRLSQSIAVDNERHQGVIAQRDESRAERDALQGRLEAIESAHQVEVTNLSDELRQAAHQNNTLTVEADQFRYKQAELSEEIKQLRKKRDRLMATRDKQAITLHGLEVAQARLKENVVGLELRLSIADNDSAAKDRSHQEALTQQQAHIDSLKVSLKTNDKKKKP